MPELRHGISTHDRLEGLRGAADLHRDGIVTLQEPDAGVERQVRAKSRAVGGTQHPSMTGELEGAPPMAQVSP